LICCEFYYELGWGCVGFFGEYSVGKLDIFDLEFFGGKSGKFE
jgi:hypothetical protein